MKIMSENQQEELLGRLTIIWKRNPDLRFGQLIENIRGNVTIPLFYITDHIFIELMKGSQL